MSETQLKELKAQAYDLIAQVENLESQKKSLIEQLQKVNAEIMKLLVPAPVPLKPELAST